MPHPASVFEIVDNQNCPLYTLNDRFSLSGRAVIMPQGGEGGTVVVSAVVKSPAGKGECRVLAGDLTDLLVRFERVEKIPAADLRCRGCGGSVRLACLTGAPPPEAEPEGGDAKMMQLLRRFSIFQTIAMDQVQRLLPFFKLRRVAAGTPILRKGEPGTDLFIVLGGGVEVLEDDGTPMAVLRRGELFGEMSLLSGEPVGSTVRAMETTTLLRVAGKDFRSMLRIMPSLQIYLARLLTQRLARSNRLRKAGPASGMAGQLSDLPPAELYQTLKFNEKSGVLRLALPGGPARLLFREGDLIHALYAGRKGVEAFYETLRAREGGFRFLPGLPAKAGSLPVLGDFMWLLMEGLRRIDDQEP
jgi:hypothetical protein